MVKLRFQLVLLLILLSSLLSLGCIEREKVVYYENQTKIEELKASLIYLNVSLADSKQANLALNSELEVCTNRTVILESQLLVCQQLPPKQISNCTDVSMGKALFTSAEMSSQNLFLTRYVCFWSTAARYGFGKYYDVASVAGNPAYSLPDVLACYWSIKEFAGVRASTGSASGTG